MATRFYLPSSGTPAFSALPVHSSWENTGDVVRLPMSTQRSNTALTTRTLLWPTTAATNDWIWWQFQSPPIMTPIRFTYTHTARCVIGKCGETTTNGNTGLAVITRLIGADGADIGTLNTSMQAGGSEFLLIAAAASKLQGPDPFISDVLAPAGSRIIVELGVRGTSNALENIQMRTGDPLGIQDFSFTDALTNDIVSWFELSADVDFGDAYYNFFWINDATIPEIIIKPIQAANYLSMTVANGQIIPIKGKLRGSGALVVGLLP